MAKTKKKSIKKKSDSNKSEKTKKIIVPLSVIISILGTLLLAFNFLPFLGWVFLILSFLSGFASFIKINIKHVSKISFLAICFCVVLSLLAILYFSAPALKAYSFKTYLDVKLLLFYLFG